MTFNVHVSNVGKLVDANIRISKFTVFAGPNSTGKSFVSKLLYSLFDAMNANHAAVYLDATINRVQPALRRLIRWASAEGEEDNRLLHLSDEIDAIRQLTADIGDLDELPRVFPDMRERTTRMAALASDLHGSRKARKRRGEPFIQWTLRQVTEPLIDLNEKLGSMDADRFLVSGIEHKIQSNLIQNFQISTLADLRGKESAASNVRVEGFGDFEFSNGNVAFSIPHFGLLRMQEYSRVIYLESPIYWKLKVALEDSRDAPSRSLGPRERLTGVPGYFFDLAHALKAEYTGDPAFPDVYERLTGDKCIGGRVLVSETGSLSFQESDRTFALSVTATGIANLGMLALLIERKVLDQGAFIFIDEPEAHLHPSWQVLMAETLFELSRRGVHVVIATHSVDILKWLEVHVKKNPETQSEVALNAFPFRDDDVGDDDDFERILATIKHELTKPFADLYLKGI